VVLTDCLANSIQFLSKKHKVEASFDVKNLGHAWVALPEGIGFADGLMTDRMKGTPGMTCGQRIVRTPWRALCCPHGDMITERIVQDKSS